MRDDILGVRFEYSDGLDWYDNWGEVKGKAKAANSQRQQSNLEGMPEAVRITLLLDSNPKSKTNPQTGERTIEPPMVFQTVARLNLADAPPSRAPASAGDNSNDRCPADQSGAGTRERRATINRAKPRFHSHRFAVVLALLRWWWSACCTRRGWICSPAKISATKSRRAISRWRESKKPRRCFTKTRRTAATAAKITPANFTTTRGNSATWNLAAERIPCCAADATDEGGGVIYGVSDEESRLNVNTADSDDTGQNSTA